MVYDFRESMGPFSWNLLEEKKIKKLIKEMDARKKGKVV